MVGENKVISKRTARLYFGSGAALVLYMVAVCGITVAHAQKDLREEHAARVQAEEENEQARALMIREKTLLDAETAQLEICHKISSQNLSDSIARLQTKTLLVTSLPEQPAGAVASLLPAVQRAGLLGLLLEVVQQSQKQTGHAAAPSQVWIIPTSVEPNFAGDVSRAWVIHAEAASGKPVDAPHHPTAVQ